MPRSMSRWLAARPALDHVFGDLAFTKIALVVLRELPASLIDTLGKAKP